MVNVKTFTSGLVKRAKRVSAFLSDAQARIGLGKNSVDAQVRNLIGASDEKLAAILDRGTHLTARAEAAAAIVQHRAATAINTTYTLNRLAFALAGAPAPLAELAAQRNARAVANGMNTAFLAGTIRGANTLSGTVSASKITENYGASTASLAAAGAFYARQNTSLLQRANAVGKNLVTAARDGAASGIEKVANLVGYPQRQPQRRFALA